jgi:hypothetical protein
MCVEPDFPTKRDHMLCSDHDAGPVFVQLGAHWLIAHCRKVRLHAQCLIASADICPAPSRRWSSREAIFHGVSA